jgi:hypothetical protein
MLNRDTARRSWRSAALAVALPLMLASPAAASAGQQAAGEAQRAPAPSPAVILSAPVDAGCDWLPPSCTLRFNRDMTRRARNAAQLAGSLGGTACAGVPLPQVKGVCAAVIAATAGVLATAASNYYEDGDCLGIKIIANPIVQPAVAVPVRVKHGDHNCS